MIRALLFDLDDTLYPERDYVVACLDAVAGILEERSVGSRASVREELVSLHFGQGREGVFDRAASRLGFPVAWIPDLVAAYRAERPALEPYPDVIPELQRLRLSYKLGCVSDGWLAVQQGKLDALGLAPLFDAVVLTGGYAREHWKPHPFAFERCLEQLGVLPGHAAFVGDNPRRDLDGARGAGLLPIRMARPGGYFGAEPDGSGAPGAASGVAPAPRIETLGELGSVLAKLGASLA